MIGLNQKLAALSPEKRALLEARLLQSRKTSTTVPSMRAPLQLSFAQRSLWFLDRLQGRSHSYTIPQAMRIDGGLDLQALQKSFETLVQRHEALRTQIVDVDGKPEPRLVENVAFILPLIDLSREPASERSKNLNALIEVEATHWFDLQSDLMLRASVVRLEPCRHVLLLNVHHIASDHWSFAVLYRELEQLYSAYHSGKASPLPPLTAQYSDYARAQTKFFATDKFQKQLSYWKEQLAGELPTLELTTDRPRPKVQRFVGGRKHIEFSIDLSAKIKAFSQREGVTLYVTLLTAFQSLLHRYTQQNEVIVGTPFGARGEIATEQLIGYFLNTLVIKSDFRGEPSFAGMLRRTSTNVLGAFEHDGVPFEQLLDVLQVPRSPDRNPLFQTMFQFQPNGTPLLQLAGTQTELLPLESGTSKMDLVFTLAQEGETLGGNLEYNSDLFDSESIERMLTHYTQFLEVATALPNQAVARIEFLDVRERSLLLDVWNQTRTEYLRESSIHQLFEAQVERTPDAVALSFGQQQLSYRELNERSNQLAHHLIENGAQPDSLVGISMGRSIELIVGLLAILKAGGAYVPFDANYPAERLAFMLQDTAVSLVITDQSDAFAAAKTIHPNDFPQRSTANIAATSNAENLAYVLYTSGSTGTPKGVAVPHRAIIRLVQNTNYMTFSSNDVFLQLAPISFDASTLEIWGCLLNGARLVIAPPQPPSLEELGRIVQSNRITTLWLTAGLFHQMIEFQIESLRGVKQLLAGGDVLSPSHVVKAVKQLPDCAIINGYGPTENTTFSCCYSIPKDFDGTTAVPIGKPISNTTAYILDSHLQLVPIGIPGELYFGGDGLARGYWNRPELTPERFLPNPFREHKRLYKTGDKARFLPDGTIEFLGRLDQQVKIRGFRIELEEIEEALSKHPCVRQSTLVIRQNANAEKYLIAYYLTESNQPDVADLRAHLEQKLPGYMIPQYFVALPEFPLDPNGKIDRKKLPGPEKVCVQNGRSLLEPRNELETALHVIWRDVLGRNGFGVSDNFFELGGHSLLATQVVSRINQALSIELSLTKIFEHPTIESLALVLNETPKQSNKSQPVLARRKPALSKTRVETLNAAPNQTLAESCRP